MTEDGIFVNRIPEHEPDASREFVVSYNVIRNEPPKIPSWKQTETGGAVVSIVAWIMFPPLEVKRV